MYWTRRSGRTSNGGGSWKGLSRHPTLGLLLLLLLFLTRSIIVGSVILGNGVTGIGGRRCR